MKSFLSILLAALLLLGTVALGEEIDRETDAVQVVEQFFAGEFDALWDRFTPEVQAQVPRDTMPSMGQALKLQFGGMGTVQSIQVIGPVVNIFLNTPNMDVVAQVVYTDDNQIAGFGFVPNETAAVDTSLAEGEEEVAVGPKALAGVLSIPKDAQGKVPAVVLVQGSGPSDRNEAVGDVKVFMDIAHGLMEQGVAVLRYDKRTYAWQTGALEYTEEELANITVYEETIEDAVAGVQLLRADERIDPDRVFIIGHSQGAVLATRMQQAGADADGLILLAGTLRHVTTLAADQLQALADQGMQGMEEEIRIARELPQMTEEEAREHTLLGSRAYALWEEAQHDLAQAAEENDAPMLILQGEDDIQVYADVDYELWLEFAQAHPEKEMDFILYPGLGHLFDVDGHVSAQVISDMAAWILER